MANRSPRGSGNNRSLVKKGKSVDAEQLSETLIEVEKSWRNEAKQRAAEEKKHATELNVAKKAITKEVRSAAGAVRKKEMEVKKQEQKINQIERQRETLGNSKSRQSERFDQKLGRCSTQSKDYEAALASKMSDLGEAKGRLAHARFAENMVGKGLPCPIDDSRGHNAANQLMDGDDSSMMDMPRLELLNARLTNENQELVTRLEMAEGYVKEMEERLSFSPRTSSAAAYSRFGSPLPANVIHDASTPMRALPAPLGSYVTPTNVGSYPMMPAAGGMPMAPPSLPFQTTGSPLSRPQSIPRFMSTPQSPIRVPSQAQPPVRMQSQGRLGMVPQAMPSTSMPPFVPSVTMPSSPRGGSRGFPAPTYAGPAGFSAAPMSAMSSPVPAFGFSSSGTSVTVPPMPSLSATPAPLQARPVSTVPGGLTQSTPVLPAGQQVFPTNGVPRAPTTVGATVFPSGLAAQLSPRDLQFQSGYVEASTPISQQFGSASNVSQGSVGRRASMTDLIFDSLDRNRDGTLSRAEFKAGLKGKVIHGNF